ncbi:cell death regulator Aven [Discoglossus pictus]
MERSRGRYRRGGGGRRRGGSRGDGGGTKPSNTGHARNEDTRAQIKAEEGTACWEEDQDVTSEFSRRKILSNWERYAEAEKEEESSVLQRGTDYGVLLGSAGDSFTQFRFTDERDWDTEKTSNRQAAALYIDAQALAWALQVLPLYLRLNVDPELVQESLPQELPQCKVKDSSTLASALARLPATPATPTPVEPCTAHPTKSAPDLPLDEELDFLLRLETPIREDTDGPSANEVNDPEVTCEGEGSPVADNFIPPSEELHKAVTPDDLEDWLDSMIS